VVSRVCVQAFIDCYRHEKEGKLMRKGRLAILSLIAVLIAAMLAVPAGAAGQTYTATLSGAEEVPPRTTTAAGKAEFVVSADGSWSAPTACR
jgi:hypothetical protein